MKIRKFYLLALTASVIAAIMLGCDTAEPPATGDNGIENGGFRLAPENPNQKVYAVLSTKTYHLANCRYLTEDKVVMLENEAIESGYIPCERCFPSPEEPTAPHVYVIDTSDHYHLALCCYLDDTKEAIPKSEAIDLGYTPCPSCHLDPPVLPPSRVWVTPETSTYHMAFCPCLTDDKVLMLKAEAIEAGYTPCSTCYWQTKRIIRDPIVWVAEYGQPGDDVYHIYEDCQSLYGSKIPMLRSEAIKEGRRLCEHCEERKEKGG